MQLIFFVLLFLVIKPASGLTSDRIAAAHPQASTRIINFPAAGLGRYYTCEPPETFMLQWPVVPLSFPARGRVCVPSGASISLDAPGLKGNALRLLRMLRANDIQGLNLTSADIKPESVAHICLLKGIRRLALTSTPIGDSDLMRISSGLPGLEQLDLGSTTLTDRCVNSFSKMRNLKVLRIDRTSDAFAAAAVARLARHQTLAYLDLKLTGIGDSSLKAISTMPRIVTLNLCGTRITHNGLRYLLSSNTLKRLDVSQTSVDDQTIKDVIGKMGRLEELNLSATRVTDAGLAHLSGLRNLRKLWLRDLLKVTDASIPQLARHSKLEDLEIQRTGITVKGVKELGKLLPKSEVHAKQPCSCRRRLRVNW
ncbi:MAG TPA: hypothetical protein V6D17_08065 [Candidatus Obscuribacterales bacterium]